MAAPAVAALNPERMRHTIWPTVDSFVVVRSSQQVYTGVNVF